MTMKTITPAEFIKRNKVSPVKKAQWVVTDKEGKVLKASEFHYCKVEFENGQRCTVTKDDLKSFKMNWGDLSGEGVRNQDVLHEMHF